MKEPKEPKATGGMPKVPTGPAARKAAAAYPAALFAHHIPGAELPKAENERMQRPGHGGSPHNAGGR